jgi:hypothetical protein
MLHTASCYDSNYFNNPKIHLRFNKILKVELPLLRTYNGAEGYLLMGSKEMLDYSMWNLHCSHLHAVVSLGYIPMESTKEMGYPDWNLLKSCATSLESTLQPSTCCCFHRALYGVYRGHGRFGWNLLKS